MVFSASSDSQIFWVYGSDESPYSGIELVDTSSKSPPYTKEFGLNHNTELRDVGYDPSSDSIMSYFTFDYQFNDSNPGWSGFKLMWEERDWTWDVTPYDSLVIKYIGPLASHKVDIFFGETYDRYAPAFLDSIGTLSSNYAATYSSGAWKTVTIPFPSAPVDADRTQVREIRFIIHNIDGVTQLTSAPGNFSFDKVGFKKATVAGIKANSNRQPLTNNRLYFTPAMGGSVDLSLYSLSGRLLGNKQMSVIAGKRYSIKQFASENGQLSGSQIVIMRIRGAGVNVQEMVR
jgi:hypothetical protein